VARPEVEADIKAGGPPRWTITARSEWPNANEVLVILPRSVQKELDRLPDEVVSASWRACRNSKRIHIRGCEEAEGPGCLANPRGRPRTTNPCHQNEIVDFEEELAPKTANRFSPTPKSTKISKSFAKPVWNVVCSSGNMF
jgi:hypothetical protein